MTSPRAGTLARRVKRVGGRGIEHADDSPRLVVLADVEVARLRETASNHLLDHRHGLFAGFVPREVVPVDALLDDEHDPRSLRAPHVPDDARNGREKIIWMTPDIDVARPLLLRERDPDQAAGVAELDAGDKSSGSFGNPHRLLVLEPVTDASTEELGDERQLRLVPTEFRLEIAGVWSLVLEQAVKRQRSRGEGHGDRCIIR